MMVIVDLSYPVNKSVNAGTSKDIYLNTPYQRTLPSIDLITNQVKKMGKACCLYKVDICRALDYDLLGIFHDSYYVKTCLPFGFRHRSAIFLCLSDAVRHIMRQRQFDVINYIDDVIGIDLPSKIWDSYATLTATLQDLGFQLSGNKIKETTTKMN